MTHRDRTTAPRLLGPTVLAAILTAALLLTGCTATAGPSDAESSTEAGDDLRPLDELDVLADPTSFEGPSTATLPTDEVEALVEPGEAALPTTVVSHDLTGDVEQVVDDASRVLALDISGALAATVFGLGLGDTLIGRDVSTTFAGAADLPVVTQDGHSINAEAVLALRPTLVVTDGTIGPTDVVQQLRQSGVTVVYVENEPSPDGAADLARSVAAAFGVPDAGDRLATIVADRIDAVEARIASIAPADPDDRLRIAFLYLRGGSGVYYLLGEGTGADALATSLGGVDVAAEIGWEGARPMTDEALVAADPDLFLVMTGGLESVGGIEQLLSSRPAVALTTAGQHRRFVDMADGQILGFGPRTPAVLEALARAVYAPAG